MVSKLFKNAKITLVLDESEDEMIIDHNLLQEGDQFMIKQVKQLAYGQD